MHTSEHVHHKPSHYHGKSHSFDESSHDFASDLKPLYVSHTPVHQSSHDAPPSYGELSHGFQPSDDAFPEYSHDFHSKLHTSIPTNYGFGSHEGKAMNYEVNEAPEGLFRSSKAHNLGSGKMTEAFSTGGAYPYPLAQDEEKAAEYLFGFDPKASSYDFTDFKKK